MRTTIRLEDALLDQAKREAARREETLTALIEQGLRLVLAQSNAPRQRKRVTIPVCRAGEGTLRGVELNNSASLLDIMDGHR
jgi:hypothetical protein